MFFAKRNEKPSQAAPKTRPAPGNPAEGMMRKLFSLKENWYKNTDIVKNNYELGLTHFQRGNISDAVFRFKLVTWIEPAHGEAWYYLGRSQLAEGKLAQASESLKKALKLKPDHELAGYFLALALGKSAPAEILPRRMPRALVTEHFDAIAATYNKEQLESFEYKGHMALIEAVRPLLVQGRIDHIVVELGVGTGLCGALLQDVSAHITGVDISQKMLEEAMKVQAPNGKKIYDALIHRDAVDFLKEVAPDSADIVLACQLISYMGDVEELFAQAARVLKPGGLFGVTAEKMDGSGYRFDPAAGVFRYGATYLQDLAAKSGLAPAASGEANVYPDLPAHVFVFRK
jgi:predicted TPR repeat methyltransferase